MMTSATDREAKVEPFALNSSNGTYVVELARVCEENELVIAAWSPIHLRSKLRELYWKESVVAVRASTVWEDMQKYLYLPRLRQRGVLEQAIQTGAATRDFFGTAYGQNGDTFDGFKLGDPNLQFDDTLLLIEPATAAAYAVKEVVAKAAVEAELARPTATEPMTSPPAGGPPTVSDPQRAGQKVGNASPPRAKAFFGSVDVSATTAKMKLVSISEEIIAVLAADPNASVKVTLEISAEFPNGATEQTKRAVAENAAALGFKSKLWE
jgi:hypothetical protein